MELILNPGNNLPPGLLLPLPEENTAQFLSENFKQKNLTFEDVLDYGGFVVALISWAAEDTGRVSLMPKRSDFQAMHDAGYGISTKQIEKFGGLRKVQSGLGFCADGQDMTQEALMTRLLWLAKYAIPSMEEGEVEPRNITLLSLLKWGARRHLIHGEARTAKILNGSTLAARQLLDLEKKTTMESVSRMDVYRFGHRILSEHGAPISKKKISALYADVFPTDPYYVIRWRFGTLTKFWLEFGKVHDASGMTAMELRDLGVRKLIQNPDIFFAESSIAVMSRRNEFASKGPVIRYFTSIPLYRQAVTEAYESYLKLRTELADHSVSSKVTQAICTHAFEYSHEFEEHMIGNIPLLIKLSRPDAAYVVQIIERGFDLSDEAIFAMQLEDVHQTLKKVGVRNAHDLRVVFGFVPRCDAEEVMTQLFS